MKSLIENYINGNLATARSQARRFSYARIALALRNDYGFSVNKANLVAHWLKTGEGWQASCDAN